METVEALDSVDLLEMLLSAAETGTEVLGGDYLNSRICEFLGLIILK